MNNEYSSTYATTGGHALYVFCELCTVQCAQIHAHVYAARTQAQLQAHHIYASMACICNEIIISATQSAKQSAEMSNTKM